jgi:cell division protein FtsB
MNAPSLVIVYILPAITVVSLVIAFVQSFRLYDQGFVFRRMESQIDRLERRNDELREKTSEAEKRYELLASKLVAISEDLE